jgi:hypothetical protein
MSFDLLIEPDFDYSVSEQTRLRVPAFILVKLCDRRGRLRWEC